MRFATLKEGTLVQVVGRELRPLADAGFDGDMRTLAGLDRDALRQLADPSPAAEPAEPERLTAPVPNPSKIVAIGLNYDDHATETQLELPKEPLVFAKYPNALTGPTDPIVIPEGLTRQVDYEAELGVVIGRRARHVSTEQALGHVFGYMVVNDVSARDLQFADKQWTRGKSLDTFCPCGPVVVTPDELDDVQGLTLGCEVDGRELQRASTRDMIFGVARLVAYLSMSFTLEPGDLIATGTPSGVGYTRRPPVYLHPGTTVRTWVAGIGELRNPVVAA